MAEVTGYWNSYIVAATGRSWTNAASLLNSDTTEGYVAFTAIETSATLRLYNWNASVPSNATIEAVDFEMMGRLSTASGLWVAGYFKFQNGTTTRNLVSTWTGSTEVMRTTKSGSTPTSLATWGISESAARAAIESTSSSDGVRLYTDHFYGAGSVTAYHDWVRMVVTYSLPSSGGALLGSFS